MPTLPAPQPNRVSQNCEHVLQLHRAAFAQCGNRISGLARMGSLLAELRRTATWLGELSTELLSLAR